MPRKRINQDVEIAIVPAESAAELSLQQRKKIAKILRDKFLLPSSEPYHKVQVEVQRSPDGSPEELVATMMRALTYTADVVTLKVDSNFNLKSD